MLFKNVSANYPKTHSSLTRKKSKSLRQGKHFFRNKLRSIFNTIYMFGKVENKHRKKELKEKTWKL